MDLKKIEMTYNSELAVLKNKRQQLLQQLKEHQAALGMSDEEFTEENLKAKKVELESQVTEKAQDLETLIKEYEELKDTESNK